MNDNNNQELAHALYRLNKAAKVLRDARWGYVDGEELIEALRFDKDFPEGLRGDSENGIFVEDSYGAVYTSVEGIKEDIESATVERDRAERRLDEEDFESEEEKEELEDDVYFQQDAIDELEKLREALEWYEDIKYRYIIDDIYELKNEVLEKFIGGKEVELSVGVHEFPHGDVRRLYKLGDYSFHGEDVSGDLTEEEGKNIQKLEKISSENVLAKDLPVRDAVKILRDFLEKMP